MKINAGGKYRTRDGRMACVLARVPEPIAKDSEEWLGCVATDHGFEAVTWYHFGIYVPGQESAWDIMEPWETKS
jgi:hypothetical protein